MNEKEFDYRGFGYNKIKCGICGRPWDGHPQYEYCYRYRPVEVVLQVPLPEDVASIIDVNLPTEDSKT